MMDSTQFGVRIGLWGLKDFLLGVGMLSNISRTEKCFNRKLVDLVEGFSAVYAAIETRYYGSELVL
jgi:hypothetical protein